jgi:hypothetical protein
VSHAAGHLADWLQFLCLAQRRLALALFADVEYVAT